MKNPLLLAWLAVESFVYWMEEHLGFLGFALAMLTVSVPFGVLFSVLIVGCSAWLANA